MGREDTISTVSNLRLSRWVFGGILMICCALLLLTLPDGRLSGLFMMAAAVTVLTFAQRQHTSNRHARKGGKGQQGKTNGKMPGKDPNQNRDKGGNGKPSTSDKLPEKVEDEQAEQQPESAQIAVIAEPVVQVETNGHREESDEEIPEALPTTWQETLKAMKWQQAALLIGAVALMFVGQFQIFRDPSNIPTSGAYMLIWLGLGGFFLVLNGTIIRENGKIPLPGAPEPLKIKPRWLIISIGCAAVTAWRSTLKPPEAYLGEHLLFWFLSMGTFVLAFMPMGGEKPAENKDPLKRWEYGLLIGLLVVGFAVRWINIDQVPHVLDQDEAIFAHEGAIIRSENFLATPFEPGIHSHPRLYQAMIGLSTVFYGDTLPGARLPSVLLGALGLPALYLLGREMFGWKGGLIAAGFMAGWSFHVEFSRLSMNQPADPLFGTLSFYFLLRGLRRTSTVDYALSGIMLGVAQLFYLGGRLIPLVMIAYLVFIFIAQRNVIKKQWKRLFIVPLGLFIITIPQNYYLLYFQLPVSTRADKSILGSDGQLNEVITTGANLMEYMGNQIKYSFMALFSTGDQSGWYGRGSNLLGPFGGPLLLIGVIMSLLVIWKRPKWSLAIGWAFAVILSGSTLAISPPQYERYYPAVAAFSLLVAMGVLSIATGLTKFLSRPQWTGRIALGIGAAVFAANLGLYVFDYVPAGNYVANRQDWVTNRTADEMVAAYSQGRQVALVGQFATGMENTIVVQYFMVGKKYFVFDTSVDDLLKQMDKTKPYLFVVAPERTNELAQIIAAWPGGNTYQIYLDEDKSFGFYVYKSADAPAVSALPTSTSDTK